MNEVFDIRTVMENKLGKEAGEWNERIVYWCIRIYMYTRVHIFLSSILAHKDKRVENTVYPIHHKRNSSSIYLE